MVNLFLREEATPSTNVTLPDFDTVSLEDAEQEGLADFLTAEGLLLRQDINTRDYNVASALVDGLIRSYVIPKKFW